MKKLLSLALMCLTFLMTAPDHVLADDVSVGDLVISDIWARASPKNAKMGAVYITIKNNGSKMEMIKMVSSPIAGKAMVHESKMVDGVMKMEHAMHVMIKPGDTLTMKPGSFHIMLMKLKEQLTEDLVIPVTVMFDVAGKAELSVVVKKK